jgi:hypothetical protein
MLFLQRSVISSASNSTVWPTRSITTMAAVPPHHSNGNGRSDTPSHTETAIQHLRGELETALADARRADDGTGEAKVRESASGVHAARRIKPLPTACCFLMLDVTRPDAQRGSQSTCRAACKGALPSPAWFGVRHRRLLCWQSF